MRNILGRRRIRAVAVVAAVLTLATTASAGTTHAPSVAKATLACQPEEGLPVVTVEGLTTTLPQPAANPGGPWTEERTRFVLDLGEVPAGTTAKVTASMSWTIPSNDWDLRMEDAAGATLDKSMDGQPSNPPVEQVSAFERPHCGVFTLVSINCCAAVPTSEDVDSLDTVISVTFEAPPPPPPGISLDDCHMTLHLFRDSGARLSEWIPDDERYSTIGTVVDRPDQAWLTFWFYSCQDVAIDGGPSRATDLSLVGIVIKDPEKSPADWTSGWQGGMPTIFAHYLVSAQTDNGKLASHLQGAGMPVERVRSIEFQRPNEFDAFTFVDSADGSFFTEMSGHRDDTPHFHDNSFWHYDPSLGESMLRIQIGSPEHPIADDWSCKGYRGVIEEATEPLPPCSRVSAEPGSEIERLLGAPTRDESAAFNHLPFDATASLVSKG